MRKIVAPLALAATLLAGSAVAQPEDDVALARKLFVEGAKLAEEGRWEAARERFAASLQRKRAALTLYNLGIAQQETGHLVDALDSFRAFLAQPVEPATEAYVPPVREVVTKLERRVGRVHVDVRPAKIPGLVVRIDGRDAGADPGPILVDPGAHEIAAVAPGYGEVRQKAMIPEGGTATIAVHFAFAPLDAGSTALPMGLGLAGLGLFLGGEVVFAVGAGKAGGPTSFKNTPTSLMVAGQALAGAGAVAAGLGLAVLLRRTTKRTAATLDPVIRF